MANLQGPMLSVQEMASHLGHHSKLLPAHPSPRTPVRSPPNFTLSSGSILSSQSMDKPVYCFQHPGAASNPDGSGCKLIEYRGAQVAAFKVDGRELICLPQAFDLFLKNLVGGLHTVYTKLKRLDITPVVCNVEQVRILRGLGAIQPGVNRCKLISPREFDVLYDDCTNSSARPGRPPKRSALITPDTLEQLKRSKLNGFSDFYAHNRLIADAKKVLGYGPSAPSHSYLSYIDFKKSTMFGNCYNYAPQVTHLPLMPFGYPHGMMNLAMTAAAAASGYGLGALHREDIHPSPSVGGIRNVSVSDVGSPRSVESCPERRIGGYETNSSGVIVHVTDVQRTNGGGGGGGRSGSSAAIESSEKPLNLEVNKPYKGHSINEYTDGGNRCESSNGDSQGNRFDSDSEERQEKMEVSIGRRGGVGESGRGGHGRDENGADSDVDSDVMNGDDVAADDRFRSAGTDVRHLVTSHVTPRDDDVCSHDLKSERASSHCHEEEEDDEDDEEDEDEDEEDRGGDVDDISSAFSLRLFDRDEGLRSPVSVFPPSSAAVEASSAAGQYSIEALLANIQGLIKMAAENARHREQQTRMEKAILQKRLKKEQETRRVLEERLNNAMKHINIQYHSSSSAAASSVQPTTDASIIQLQDPRHTHSHTNASATENNVGLSLAETDIFDGKPSAVIVGHLSDKMGTGKTVESLMDPCLSSASKTSGIEFMNHKDFRFTHDCDRN